MRRSFGSGRRFELAVAVVAKVEDGAWELRRSFGGGVVSDLCFFVGKVLSVVVPDVVNLEVGVVGNRDFRRRTI